MLMYWETQMAEIIRKEYFTIIGGTAALLRFDSAYITEQAKVSEDARTLIDEALDLLRKASNHDRWRCKERFQIGDDLYKVERQLEKMTDELSDIASALKKGAERFAELEVRAAGQEGELNAELRKAWAFEADVWDPDSKLEDTGTGIPEPAPTPLPDPIDSPDTQAPEQEPEPESDALSSAGPEQGDDGKGREWSHRRHRDRRLPGEGRIPIRIQPLPVLPTPMNPIVIYVPYAVSAQPGVEASSGGVSMPLSSVSGSGSGGYVPAASTGSPVTFSYPGSSGGSYGASSLSGSDFFSGGISGSSGNGSTNELLRMLLAWLTQIMSGQSGG